MKALLSLLMLCSACAFGQRRVDVDNDASMITSPFFQAVNGVPVVTNLYYKVVEGSAFYTPDWVKGTVAFDEKRYGNVWLKLDLVANQVHFKNDKEEELICATLINRITLNDPQRNKPTQFVYSSFVPTLSSFRPEAWLEVLAEGRAGLYTHHKKSISETRPYGSATLEQRIITADIHYLVYNNQYIRVKKLADLTNALADKKTELQQWIRDNNIDGKNPADLGRVVDAYNNMFPKS